jgi:hypothetical protein
MCTTPQRSRRSTITAPGSKGDWTIDGFLDNPQFNDFMTRRIAGGYDVELAKRRLRDEFAFVGLTERFDESLLLMKSRIGLAGFNTLYERENASEERTYQSDVRQESEDVLERVRRNNVLDMELYRFVRDELYPSYVRQFEGDLELAAAQRSERRAEFNFSRVRRGLWLGYRHVLYRHIEWTLHRWYGRPWRDTRAVT